MRNRILISLFIILCATTNIAAQDYISGPVTISEISFMKDGTKFFAHSVLEKQTLYSICKAYQVSPQDIYEANPDLHIETEGLKKGQVIMIPNKLFKETSESETKVEEVNNYKKYIVKWFDDLDSIAQKFGVSKAAIMAANGLKTEKLSKKQVLRIPLDKDETIEEIVEDYVAAQQDIDEEQTDEEELVSKSYDPSQTIKLSLVLPFKSAGTLGDGSMDFYCGAMLALKNLGEKGINSELDVYDVSELNPMEVDGSDVVLGPISPADVSNILNIVSDKTILVSPLDSRVSSLVPEHPNLIQAPSSAEGQLSDLVSWIKEDMTPADRLILISEKGVEPNALAGLVEDSGLEYETVSYGILEGRNVVGTLSSKMTKEGGNRVLIASDKEAFINDVVRNLDLITFEKFNVILYAPSKVKNYENINVENFHNTQMHMSSSYYVDYDNDEIKSFLLSYRALFKAEPSQYAYQGYDLVRFFVTRMVEYGNQWERSLTTKRGKGLQSDLMFKKSENGGYSNEAVRRTIYSSEDYSVNMISK